MSVLLQSPSRSTDEGSAVNDTSRVGFRMKRFEAIEGLRGWLAWTVAISHIFITSGIYLGRIGSPILFSGHAAVLVFVVISGFVISHLLVERQETYSSYILRRFFRIFPLFAVTCFIGYFATDLYVPILSRVPWYDDPVWQIVIANNVGASSTNHEYFWSNILTHATMLHGIVPNSVIPYGTLAFNMPAWSLSLEWQFYLLAPFVLRFVNRASASAILGLSVVVFLLGIGYQLGWLGWYMDPTSVVLAVAGYFALGICSRIALPYLTRREVDCSPVAALAIMFLPLGWQAVPVLIWILVLCGLVQGKKTGSEALKRLFGVLLSSRLAIYFGERSYSIYLSHLPIVTSVHVFWFHRFPSMGRAQTLALVAATSIPAIILASEILYRSIEKPGIRLGSLIVKRLRADQSKPVEALSPL